MTPADVPPLRFVSYLRVSTGRQGRSSLGLEAQRHAVAAHIAVQRGGVLMAEFVEVESGKRNDRPEPARFRSIGQRRRSESLSVSTSADRVIKDARGPRILHPSTGRPGIRGPSGGLTVAEFLNRRLVCPPDGRMAAHLGNAGTNETRKPMEYRPFGKTTISTSAIGFGCWEIGGTYGAIEETSFQKAVHQAIDSGITCFDTAEAYGMGISEQALSRALGTRRHEVTIVTKFGVGYPEMPKGRDSTRARAMASIEASLKRLNTDHVDVFMVHWPDPNTPFEETFAALDEIMRQGKVRYIGVSNFRLSQIEAVMKLRRVDVVQYAWNMFDRRMMTEIFPYCAANQIGVMAYGSLAYGMLTGTFSHNAPFEENDWRSRRGTLGTLNLFRTLFGPDHYGRNLAAVEELKTLAAKYGKTLPQFALRWTLGNPAISTALVGFRHPSEVLENLGSLGWSISDADMKEVDAIFERHGATTTPPGWLEDE